jgi:CheY-like chemotaxis protein
LRRVGVPLQIATTLRPIAHEANFPLELTLYARGTRIASSSFEGPLMMTTETHIPASGTFALPARLPRVLLAEDDDEMRLLLADELRHDGYDVLEARDGKEMELRLKSVRHCPLTAPDVIIMDVRMPGHSGLEILTLLRTANWTTPVVLITAFPEPDIVARASELNATVFGKPFDIDDLRFAVLSHRRAA